jgi:ferredoxin
VKVRVDPGLCQGHTVCALRAPAVFDLGEVDGKAIARFDEVPESLEQSLRDAAASCPERAILIEG